MKASNYKTVLSKLAVLYNKDWKPLAAEDETTNVMFLKLLARVERKHDQLARAELKAKRGK